MTVQSPCIDICQIDGKTGWCVGCLRTREEIRGWRTMTDHRGCQILAERQRRESKVPARP
ncbi:DUF1289 domain-containing protein [Methylocapsa polymorpha]|uniref:DUF1289 domain-containing protein n=1 Tax=Methylocapsa polymorpha TaxID=3080828 RepID=A0ABZ0HWU0_9HYPH|nr:DUF1289 domain-containing protein [Methylocapsa sp. RX1]